MRKQPTLRVYWLKLLRCLRRLTANSIKNLKAIEIFYPVLGGILVFYSNSSILCIFPYFEILRLKIYHMK